MASIPKRPTIGFVTPPAWYDPGPEELRGLMGDRVGVQQTILGLDGFDYNGLENLAQSTPEMAQATRLLVLAGCDVVTHTATPFGFAGAKTEDEMRARLAAVAGDCGPAVVMAPTSILDALRALGVRRIAVATPYYQPQWQAAWMSILNSTEFDILAVQSLDQQGLSGPISDIYDMGWSMTDDLIFRSMEQLYQSTPSAEAYVLTGAGSRTLGQIEALEAVCGGKSVVASDTASLWASLRHLNLRPHTNPFGQLGLAEGDQ